MTDREPYSADDKDAFSWIDDELDDEEAVEDEIFEAGEDEDEGAFRYGTTPAEERRGLPLEEELREEQAEDLEAPVSDEWEAGPDPRAGTLVDDGVYAEESAAPAEDPEQEAIHATADDREHAERIRETWERQGPPRDPEQDRAPSEDDEPAPDPEDWR